MHRRRFLTLGGFALASLSPFGRLALGQPEGSYGPPPEHTGPLCSPTLGDAQGPFFLTGAPNQTVLGPEAARGTHGVHLRGVLVGTDCVSPQAGFGVDMWHCDVAGRYHMEGETAYLYRGLIATDADGRFEIQTVRPGNYSIGRDYMRPAHYHVKVYQPDGRTLLTTQFYFDDDPYLSVADGCQPPTCNSHDPDRYLHLVTGPGGMQTASMRIVV